MIKKFILNQISQSSPVAKQVVETIWGKDNRLKAEFGKPSNFNFIPS